MPHRPGRSAGPRLGTAEGIGVLHDFEGHVRDVVGRGHVGDLPTVLPSSFTGDAGGRLSADAKSAFNG